MSEQRRLDLSTPKAREDAARALPGLMWGALTGNVEATAMASQVMGQAITDALAPSLAALARLNAADPILARFAVTPKDDA